MTVKEMIVDMLQAKGYGFFESCEIAESTIKEARESLARGEIFRFTDGNKVYEIRNKFPIDNLYN